MTGKIPVYETIKFEGQECFSLARKRAKDRGAHAVSFVMRSQSTSFVKGVFGNWFEPHENHTDIAGLVSIGTMLDVEIYNWHSVKCLMPEPRVFEFILLTGWVDSDIMDDTDTNEARGI